MTNKKSIYESFYNSHYGFESVMVRYRRQLILDRLNIFCPNIVLEIGCGSELLHKYWRVLSGGDFWLIVEPADGFAKKAKECRSPNLEVIQAFFEDSIGQVQNQLPRYPDLIICSSLLHEVTTPSKLLYSIRAVMGPQTRLHVNVPNSESMHRRLAVAMGLIATTHALSERNLNLMQPRVYDPGSLEADIANAGLRVLETGGYMLKPFSHSQMEHVHLQLGDEVLDGLFELGKRLPELASEIWVEAMLDSNA